MRSVVCPDKFQSDPLYVREESRNGGETVGAPIRDRLIAVTIHSTLV